jgi:hypothetical protein
MDLSSEDSKLFTKNSDTSNARSNKSVDDLKVNLMKDDPNVVEATPISLVCIFLSLVRAVVSPFEK